MEITDVRIKLSESSEARLKAFCSVTFDEEFVVRDLKVIEGPNGPFVAMPSRCLSVRCAACGGRNEARNRFCGSCGVPLEESSTVDDGSRLYADVAHPINSSARHKLHASVLRALQKERQKAERPNYVCRYDDWNGTSESV